MGPLPPAEPNCCILNGKKCDNNTNASSLLSITVVPAPSASTSSRVSNSGIMMDDEDSRSTIKTNSIITTSSGTRTKRPKDYITKRKMYFMESCFPRKSPREHASTLAILSSIVNENSLKKSKDSGSDMSELMMDIDESSLDRMANIPEIPHDEDANDGNDAIKLKPTEETPIFRQPGECLTSNALCHEIDKFFRYSYRDCDESIALSCKKNIDCDLGEKDFFDIISAPCIDEKTIEETFENITTDQIKEDILVIKENRLLTRAETLHLARSAKKRIRNRTGLPKMAKRKPSNGKNNDKSEERKTTASTTTTITTTTEVHQPEIESVVDRLKEERAVNGSPNADTTKPVIPEKPNGIITTRRSFKSIFPKSNDMFTVSSDSMDSVPSLDKNDDNESVSTRSLFVSDDSSIDEVICRSPATTRLSQLNKVNNYGQINGIISSRCVSRLSNRIKLDNSVKNEKTIDDCGGGVDGEIFNSETGNTTNCHMTRRVTSNKKTPMKKRLSQPIPITPPPPQSPKTVVIKPSTPVSTSPRKLRKPRGRWYRER